MRIYLVAPREVRSTVRICLVAPVGAGRYAILGGEGGCAVAAGWESRCEGGSGSPFGALQNRVVHV